MANNKELIRQAILAKNKNKENRSNGGGGGGDNASYPFWNIPDNTTATVRFLPDADPDNVFFWRERLVIKLPFAGVVGSEEDSDREVTVSVPCVEMFGMTCPIITATRPWWKDGREEMARTYYKKRSYLFQGFVVNSPIQEENIPNNPIRRFVINKTIYEIIERSLVSQDMEDVVTDYVGGRDFNIQKTKRGDYANYSTSQWSFKSRALSEGELAAIDEHGLFDLKEYLGAVPDADGIEAIKAMFEASVAGEPYDFAQFSKYYKPYGFRAAGEGGSIDEAVEQKITQARSAPARQARNDAPATSTPASAAGTKNPSDILDRVRSRLTTK